MQKTATLKIMSIGDSITFGWPASGGYRPFLHDRLKKAGFDFSFVGTCINSPPPAHWNIDRLEHEGHQGWRIRDITRWIARWLNDFRPDVILMMIRTNDMPYETEYLYADQDLEVLVSRIFEISPGIQLFLSSLTPFAAEEYENNQHVVYYNEKVKEIIEKNTVSGRNVHFVDLFNALDSHVDIYDNCHPKESGYIKMADAFYRALEKARDDLIAMPETGGKSIYLSDMAWLSAHAADGLSPKRDHYILDDVLFPCLAKISFVKAVETAFDHDGNPSDITVDISGQQFAFFESDVGMDDAVAGECGNAKFCILADGIEIACSETMEGGGPLFHMSVSIPEQTELLTLRVMGGDKQGTKNFACWGNATLSGR
jgi:hypothetical protein